jgi:diguanylate cyclase (GGDEF)-like protein/PAS domain S-box-containing protein
MYSFDPELVALAQGSGVISTWEWIPDTDGLRWTSGRTEIYSRPASEIDSTARWESLVHPEDRARVRSAVETALQTNSGFHEKFRVEGKNGRTLWILGFGKVVCDQMDAVKVVGVNLEVTDWVEAILASEARFTSTFEQAAVGIAHVGVDGTWLRVNQRCLEIVGYPWEELRKLTFGDITHPDDLEADLALVRELLNGKRSTYSMEKRYFTKDDRLVWVNLTVSLVKKTDGSPDHFISVIEDITPRKRIEMERDQLIAELEERVLQRTAELERLSLTDPLTGIANRRAFDQCLQAEWDRAVRTRQPLSIILVDIDFFKDFNDRAGHTAGDEALKAVAACIHQAANRSTDLAARYGGDELVLALPDTDSEGALEIAGRIHKMLDDLKIKNPGSPKLGFLTLSQGVATACPSANGSSSALLLEADRALYDAKHLGRARIATAERTRRKTVANCAPGTMRKSPGAFTM